MSRPERTLNEFPKSILSLQMNPSRQVHRGLGYVHLAFLIHICHTCHMAAAYPPDVKGRPIYPSKYQMSKMCCFVTKPEIKGITCIIKKNSLVSQKNLKFSSFIYFLLHLSVSSQIWLLAWRGSLEVKMTENSELGATVTDLQEIKVEYLRKLLSVNCLT